MKRNKSKKHETVYWYETKKGAKWGYRFAFTDVAGEYHSHEKAGFHTELEAFLAYDSKRAETLALEKQTSQPRIRFRHVWKQFQAEWEGLSESSVMVYERCGRPLLELVGDVHVDDLSQKVFTELFLKKVRGKYAISTLRISYGLFKQAMDYAVYCEYLPNHPFAHFKVKSSYGRPRKGRKPFTYEQLRLFVENYDICEEEYQLIFDVLIETGVRVGECLGLEWEHLGFAQGKAHIKQQRLRDGTITETLKTKNSEGTLSYSQTLSQKLKNHQRKKQLLAIKQGIPCSPCVFDPAITSDLVRTRVKQVLRQIGLNEEDYTTHSFRHTHGSILIDQGVPITEVSKRLRHANPQVTLTTYSHSVQKDDSHLVDIFQRAVGN